MTATGVVRQYDEVDGERQARPDAGKVRANLRFRTLDTDPRACDQAGIDEGQGLAEEPGAYRSRLDQLVDSEPADDGHDDAGEVVGERQARPDTGKVRANL